SAAAVAGFGSAVANAAIPEAAFHAQGGTLWTANPNVNSNLPMAEGSGASAARTGIGTYEVAFTYNNGKLVTYGSMPLKGWPLGVAAGTTPSIAGAPGGYKVAINGSNTHYLWTGTVSGTSSSETNWSIVLPAKASPSVA